jgi:phosphate uptake regulator
MKRRSVLLVSITGLLVTIGIACSLLVFSPTVTYHVRLMISDEKGITRAATVLATTRKGRQYLLQRLPRSNVVEAKAAVEVQEVVDVAQRRLGAVGAFALGLLAAWRSTDSLKDIYAGLMTMIEAGEWMLDAVWKAAKEGKVQTKAKEEIYRRDVEVNRTQRTVRRRIAEHLIMQPGVDVPACLILMSVVKDAERIGDYCKNILEAAELEADPVTRCAFFGTFRELYEGIHALFGRTRKALTDSDATLGHEIIVEERNITGRCDALIERLAANDLPSRLGIPWALLARHLKRVGAHLGNLASSLVMPVHKLDHFDEKSLPGQQGEGA